MSPQRTWPRRLATLAVVLVAGIALTYLTAWGCIIAAPPILGRTNSMPAYAAPLDRLDPLPPGDEIRNRRIIASPWRGMSETVVMDYKVHYDADPLITATSTYALIWTAGWPRPALVCISPRGPNPGGIRGGLPSLGLASSVPGRSPRPLPFIPLWPGFLINAVAYTALIALVTLVLRRLLSRHPAGHCRFCGYNLAGLADSQCCPECGNPCSSRGPIRMA
jgi:hypothetical protein